MLGSLISMAAFAAAIPLARGEPTTDATVDDLVHRALDRDPALAAARARAQAARSGARVGASPMDPMIELDAMGTGPEMASLDVMVSQTLRPPGSLDAARGMGGARADAEDARALGDALALEGRVRAAAATCAGARARIDQLELARSEAAALVVSMRAMVSAGMASTADVTMAEMEVADIDGRIEAGRGDERAAVAELVLLTGKTPGPLTLPPMPDGAPPTGEAPMVVAMEAMARMATFETEMARRERLPPLTVSAGWSFRTKDMWDDMALAGLSISVPLFASRNQNARVGETAALAEAASRDLEAARRDLELERSQMSTELESLRVRDAAAVRMAEAARAAMEAARSAYAAGTANVSTLVTAHHRHSEALEMDAMLRTDAISTYAKLAALLGTSLLEAP